VTYPNVLVLDYMKSTGQTTPELQMKAEQFINLGYQRLLTFETPDGGFSLFGQPPADVFLTAYGLMEMYDMSKVYPVDEGVIERKAIWLLEHQNADGSWTPSHPMESWRNLPSTDLPATAYVTWALGEAGYADAEQVHKAVTYIKEMAPQAKEAYVLALVGNALATTAPDDPITRQVLDRLAEMAVIEGESAYWEGGVSSFMGATGDVVSIETTALVAYAFIKADVHPDLVNKALTYLVRNKDSFGTWQTTQATILSLKALLASVSGGEAADATVHISLNGQAVEPIRVTSENFDVVQMVGFADVPVGDNVVRLEMSGSGQLMYQISTEYYLPWDKVTPPPEQVEAVGIEVTYDRTELQVNDVIRADVRVELRIPGTANMMLVDLGIPPGFEVLSEDLEKTLRVSKDPKGLKGVRLSRFELTGRQIILYLEDLTHGEPFQISYRLRARYPIVAQTPPSQAYDYYNPGLSAVVEPVEVRVSE